MNQLPAHLRNPPQTAARALVLVDGEHYPSTVADTIALLDSAGWQIAAAVLVGGGEKLRATPEYGVPMITADTPVGALVSAAAAHDVDVVIDLADEPVLVFEDRLRVIAAAAGMGLSWIGADARIDPPPFATVDAPTLAITGTGKRIGKTAISAHIARLADTALGGNGAVIVVAMGRGGPAEPVVIHRSEAGLTVERLLEISRGGEHAASDYLEDAVLTGLTTIGCRRIGGGLLGAPVASNVPEGARLAASLDPQLIILEGSGASIPPVAATRTLLIASTARPRDLLDDFGPWRLNRADALLVIGDDRETARRMLARVSESRPDLPSWAASLRPTPVDDVSGARIAVFTTAPSNVEPVFEAALRAAGADPVLVSSALARRDELRDDIERALELGVDTFAVEIKAAGIDVVAEAADAHGIRVTFLDNPPAAHDADVDLDGALTTLALAAVDNA